MPNPSSQHTPLYTIGYATKPIATFIAQLQQYGINVVADVRSVPYSKVFHEYHKESIAAHLQRHGIRYVYLGDELGPRSKDPSHYDEAGQVQFDRLMQSLLFGQGVERLGKGVDKGFTIAMMCAEKDPAICHRSLLIGYFLQRNALGQSANDGKVLHITHDGELEQQADLEQRLCEIHDIKDDLCMSPKERKHLAYTLQLKETSYCKEDH